MVMLVLFWILGLVTSQPDGEDQTDNRFRDTGFVQDIDHLRSHLKSKIKFEPDKLSKDEMEFHFFKIHDLNDDNLLDGLEIMATLRHAYDHESAMSKRLSEMDEDARQSYLMNYYTSTVDRILKDDDTDNNGYLTYSEYVNARRAARILDRAQQQKEKRESQNKQ